MNSRANHADQSDDHQKNENAENHHIGSRRVFGMMRKCDGRDWRGETMKDRKTAGMSRLSIMVRTEENGDLRRTDNVSAMVSSSVALRTGLTS
jgi:hypothetical protein